MALNVTPGASNADSYASLADANAYFSDRGVTAWTGTDPTKEAALRKATAYLDNAYRGKWRGVRVNDDQALAWPRCNSETIRTNTTFTIALIDDDGFEIPTDAIPTAIARATMEAALLALGGTDLEPALAAAQVGIKSISKGVGPLNKAITYRDDAPMVGRYLAVENYLRGLVTGTPGASSGTVKLVRG